MQAFLASVVIGLLVDVAGAVPDLIVAALIFAIALLRPVFERAARGFRTFSWIDADTAKPTERLFKFGVSVFVGLMIWIGGSNLFGQGASGLILMYSPTPRVGEHVRIAEQEGTVTEMGAYTVTVRTGLGEELALPNALVVSNIVKNHSRVAMGAGYVLQIALTDFHPEYRLVCLATPKEPRTRAEALGLLHANIQDVFNDYGVQIMSPHYLGGPARAKVVPKSEWYPRPRRGRETRRKSLAELKFRPTAGAPAAPAAPVAPAAPATLTSDA